MRANDRDFWCSQLSLFISEVPSSRWIGCGCGASYEKQHRFFLILWDLPELQLKWRVSLVNLGLTYDYTMLYAVITYSYSIKFDTWNYLFLHGQETCRCRGFRQFFSARISSVFQRASRYEEWKLHSLQVPRGSSDRNPLNPLNPGLSDRKSLSWFIFI